MGGPSVASAWSSHGAEKDIAPLGRQGIGLEGLVAVEVAAKYSVQVAREQRAGSMSRQYEKIGAGECSAAVVWDSLYEAYWSEKGRSVPRLRLHLRSNCVEVVGLFVASTYPGLD